MGQKRPRSETIDGGQVSSPFVPLFDEFRKDLDQHHERRERVIKRSRDITAASKKIIFALQRSRTVGTALPEHIEKAVKPHRDAVTTNYLEVSKDLQGENGWRYSRNVTGGNQEYVEAATFAHYITHGQLLTYDEARTDLLALSAGLDVQQGVDLSVEDYVLGIFDMTGELMRFAITAMATSGELPVVEADTDLPPRPNGEGGVAAERRTVLSDLRALRAGLERLEVGHGSYFSKDVGKKMDVMRTSVEKVERALYGLVVRGAERPKGWLPDLEGGGGREVDVEG